MLRGRKREEERENFSLKFVEEIAYLEIT